MSGWKSHQRVRLLLLAAPGVGLALYLGGCGGSPTDSGDGGFLPIPCTQSPLLQGNASLTANTADFESFTTTTTGRVDLSLDWTFPASPFGLFVVQGPCDFDHFKAADCHFLLQMLSPPKPLKSSISNLAPGTYGLIIVNASSDDEAVAASVILSSATCPAVSLTSKSAATDDGFFLGILRGFKGSLGLPR